MFGFKIDGFICTSVYSLGQTVCRFSDSFSVTIVAVVPQGLCKDLKCPTFHNFPFVD